MALGGATVMTGPIAAAVTPAAMGYAFRLGRGVVRREALVAEQ
jgi:hypothetical protein